MRKKVNTLSGLSKQSQERRPEHSDGSPDKGYRNGGAQRPSIRNTSMAVKRPGERPVVKITGAQKVQTTSDAYPEEESSPRASEGGASVTAMDSSDLGSHSFRSVSEIATDAGYHAISEDSDNDDTRSVSSEPASRFTSQINNLTPRRSTGSKLGRGVYSSWDSEHGSDSLDSSARNNRPHGQDSEVSAAHDGEEIFPYSLDDTDSLVGDTDGLDSFLDARIADPEYVNRADGHQVAFDQFLTPEISAARHQEEDIIDLEGSTREDVAVMSNNEAALTTDNSEFEIGDCVSMEHEAAPFSERAGVVHTDAAVLPSTPEARTEILNTDISNDSDENSEDGTPIEKPHAVANADIDIAPQFPQSPNHNSDYESTIASVSFSDLGRNAERAEEISDPAPENLNHLDEAVEFAGHPDLSDSLSTSAQEKLGETSAVIPDPVHVDEQLHEGQLHEGLGLEVECGKVSEESVADDRSPKDNEDLTEMLTIAREVFEHTPATPPRRLLSERIGNNDDSTTAHANFDNNNHESSEDGKPVRDATDYVPEDIQDAKATPSEPGENRSDIKWSFVSALYDDLEDLHNTVDIGDPEHKLAEAGSDLLQDFESLKHPKSGTLNHAEPPAILVERHGGEVKEKVGTASSLVDVTQGLNGIASKSDEHKEVEHMLQKGTTGIALESDSHPPDMYTTSGDATRVGHEHEDTRSRLSISLSSDSSRLSNLPEESDAIPNVSENDFKPFSWSIEKYEVEESIKSDDLLRNSADDLSGAICSVSTEGERSRSCTLIQETFEGLREDNKSETSTEVEEETEARPGCDEEEEEGDLGVSIQTLALARKTESSTGLKEHECRLPVSVDQGDVLLQGDKHSLGPEYLPDLIPDNLEKASDDKTAATSHPRKMEKILTVGLKMIFVIGSITFGILKFRASRLRSAGSR